MIYAHSHFCHPYQGLLKIRALALSYYLMVRVPTSMSCCIALPTRKVEKFCFFAYHGKHNSASPSPGKESLVRGTPGLGKQENLALEGCLEWQKQGLGQTEAIRAATETYQREQHVIADFLTDCCILEPHATIAAKDPFEAYEKWCENNAGIELGKRKFGDRLVEKGAVRVSGHGDRAMWRGIRLIKEEERVNLGYFINQNNPTRDIPLYPGPCYVCGGEEYWIAPGANTDVAGVTHNQGRINNDHSSISKV